MERRSAAARDGDYSAKMVNMKTWAKFLRVGMLVASLLASISGMAAERSVWKIGAFNGSSGEFRSEGIDYASPKSDLVYVVGQSTDQDWYRFQPGPANGMTGGRLHPFRIRFSLPGAPRGVYHLKIAMLYETPRLSYSMAIFRW